MPIEFVLTEVARGIDGGGRASGEAAQSEDRGGDRQLREGRLNEEVGAVGHDVLQGG